MVEYHALCNALTMIILEYSSMKVKSDASNGRKSLPALIGKEESVLRFCNKSTCCCTSILTFTPIKLIFHTIKAFYTSYCKGQSNAFCLFITIN